MALKSWAAIMRYGPAVDVKEKDAVFLLEVLSSGLEERAQLTSRFLNWMSDVKSFHRIYIHGPHRNCNPALLRSLTKYTACV